MPYYSTAYYSSCIFDANFSDAEEPALGCPKKTLSPAHASHRPEQESQIDHLNMPPDMFKWLMFAILEVCAVFAFSIKWYQRKYRQPDTNIV